MKSSSKLISPMLLSSQSQSKSSQSKSLNKEDFVVSIMLCLIFILYLITFLHSIQFINVYLASLNSMLLATIISFVIYIVTYHIIKVRNDEFIYDQVTSLESCVQDDKVRLLLNTLRVINDERCYVFLHMTHGIFTLGVIFVLWSNQNVYQQANVKECLQWLQYLAFGFYLSQSAYYRSLHIYNIVRRVLLMFYLVYYIYNVNLNVTIILSLKALFLLVMKSKIKIGTMHWFLMDIGLIFICVNIAPWLPIYQSIFSFQ